MGVFSVLWCIFMIVILCLPAMSPPNLSNLNYSPLALGLILFLALASWFLSAQYWFTIIVIKPPLSDIEKDASEQVQLEIDYERHANLLPGLELVEVDSSQGDSPK